MAMVQCKECGSDVSDAAPTCPRCGVTAPGGSCTLVFVRPSLVGFAIKMEVFVGGKSFGLLGPKGRLAVPVPPGQHHFEVTTSHGKSATSTVTASGGETVVTVSVSPMGGKPKFA